MAKDAFDFKGFKDGTFNDYKNKTLKNAVLEKSKAGLVLTLFDVGAQKKIGVLIPFLKEVEAKEAFKVWKAILPGKLKKATCKAAVVKLFTEKADGGSLKVTLEITKGVKNPAKIEEALKPLFILIKKGLKVVGGSEEETTSGTSESTTDETTTEESNTPETTVDPAKKVKRAEKRSKMLEGIDKMKKAKAQGKISIEKINAQIKIYDKALTMVMTEAEEDGHITEEEKGEIQEVVTAMEGLKSDLKNEMIDQDGKGIKKLTPERREKMNKNMNKINERLEAITKKLGL
jgi:hypothetical protein